MGTPESFAGFSSEGQHTVVISESLLSDLLLNIDNLAALKLALYFLWRFSLMDTRFPFLTQAQILEDEKFVQSLHAPGDPGRVAAALDACTTQGFLLEVEFNQVGYYFLNSPAGRTAVAAIKDGRWRPNLENELPVEYLRERPTIYKLYEANIGPLTPMVADMLRDAENAYPVEWIEEAISIAVQNNKRSWRYAEAILRRWQEEGRDERGNRKDSQTDRKRYTDGEYSDYIEH
jgi:DNA replication protein